MRLHGLVSLALLGLSSNGMAQDLPAPQLLQAPRSQPALIPDSDFAAPVPVPLPSPGKGSEAGASLEEELRQLRNELKAFEAVREEVARSAKAVDAENDRAANQQRQELLDLLTRLATKRVTREPAIPVAPAPPARAVESVPPPPVTEELPSRPIADDVVDAFALGKVLFRSGDYAAAEEAFRKVKPTDENRLMLKYLSATCLRKRSQWQAATDAYRAVAESNQDPVLRDLAKWQLDNIRWHQETESQLEQMRQQREKRTESPKAQPTGPNSSRP